MKRNLVCLLFEDSGHLNQTAGRILTRGKRVVDK